jgi:hypothetical protein
MESLEFGVWSLKFGVHDSKLQTPNSKLIGRKGRQKGGSRKNYFKKLVQPFELV